MVMTNKVLKIAGKNPDGNALGIRVDSSGNLLVSETETVILQNNVDIAAGGFLDFSFLCGSPFKVFFTIDSGNPTDVPYKIIVVDEQVLAEGEPLSTAGVLYDGLINKTLLESDGSLRVIIGKGRRGGASSALTTPNGTRVSARIINNDPARQLIGKLFVVKYPESSSHRAYEYSDIISNQVVVDSETPEEVTLYDTDDFTRIEYLELGSNRSNGPTIHIYPRGVNGALLPDRLGMVRHDTGEGSGLSMATLDTYYSSLFDKMYRDSESSKYALNRYMTFPNGVRIVYLKGGSPIGAQFAIRGYAVRKG